MTAAAKAAAAGAGVVSPLVLYVMVKVFGDAATDPLAMGASVAVASVLVGGVALLVGYRTPSTTSVVSEAFEPHANGYARAGAQVPYQAHSDVVSPFDRRRPPDPPPGATPGHSRREDD